MKNNDRISGFTVLRTIPLDEIKGTMYEMEHDQTGCRLVWISRSEENKTFGIAFETLPCDDTGVFHILEHSVLCGSDKYPVKEPFVELVKNSLNTFLNAMTFPDKTLYPISSRNDKDFVNLMRVYLDAVFYPAIYHKPEIFRQEGWHIEFDNDGKASYKGVVFNEMKGAMADAESIAEMALSAAMLPDTPYAYNSGGEPASIPDLTYEQFIDSHRKYYSPSNAFIFLDGDLDIEGTLAIINDEYLKNFGRTERIAPPEYQEAVDAGSRTIEYEIGEDEDAEGKVRMIWAFNAGRFDEREKQTAIHVINEVMAGNNHSPLVEKVLAEGLAEDVIVSVSEEISQPYARIELRNMKESDIDRAREVVFAELAELAKGLDREELKSAMANMDFIMRERDYGTYPQGLIFSFNVLDSWLYGGKPEANLQIGDLFENLTAKMDEGYFEALLEEVFLKNPHKAELIMIPSKTLGSERREAEQKRIEKTLAGMSEEDIQRLKAEQESLISWQESEDTPEQLVSLPHLELSDIPEKPENFPCELMNVRDTRVLYHEIPSNGIQYINLYWDIDGYDGEQYSELSFLCNLLGNIATEKSSASEIARRSRSYCGNLGWDLITFSRKNRPDEVTVKLMSNISTLTGNVGKAVELAAEIAASSIFEDEKEVRDIIKQNRQSYLQRVQMSGHAVGIARLSAMNTAAGVVLEYIRGLEFYQWLKKTDENWNWDELRGKLIMAQEILRNASVTVSLTADNSDSADEIVTILRQGMPEISSEPEASAESAFGKTVFKPWGNRKEAVIIPADIAFAERGGNMLDCGTEWSSVAKLAARIVSYEYLWNVIRVQGGAYGAGLVCRKSGLLAAYTYRDPSGAASLDAFLSIGQFLRDFAANKPDLTGFIIGTISDASPLLMPRLKGASADGKWFNCSSYEERCEHRRKILSATVEQLEALADTVESTMNSGGCCIIGGKEQIEAFDEIETVISL